MVKMMLNISKSFAGCDLVVELYLSRSPVFAYGSV